MAAGPPSRMYRLRKFVRRNWATVLAVSLILTSLLAGVVGTTVGWVRANRQRARAEREYDEKNTALELLEEEQGKTLAALTAETNALKRAMDALRTLTNAFVQRQLGRGVALSEEDRAFLNQIAKEYEAFTALGGEGEQLRAFRAEGYYRVAFLRSALGQPNEARASYESARGHYRQLISDFPDNPDYRGHLIGCHNALGVLLSDSGKPTEAETEYRHGLALCKQLVADYPENAESRKRLAGMHSNLGNLLRLKKQYDKAHSEHRQAVRIKEQLAKEYPAVPTYRKELAAGLNNLGNTLQVMGKLPEAVAEYRRVIAVQNQLVSEQTDEPSYREYLGVSHANLAITLQMMGKYPDAEVENQHALTLLKELAEAFPVVPSYRSRLGQSHFFQGYLHIAQKKTTTAEAAFRQAMTLQKRLVRDYPANSGYALHLGNSCSQLGILLTDAGTFAEALDLFDTAIRNVAPVVKRQPQYPGARVLLFTSSKGRALVLAKLDRFTEAVKEWDQTIPLAVAGPQNVELRLQRAACLVRVSPGQARIETNKLIETGEPSGKALYLAAGVFAVSAATATNRDEAEMYAGRAMSLLARAGQCGYFKDRSTLDALRRDADFASLRGRDEFKRLITKLEATSDSPPDRR